MGRLVAHVYCENCGRTGTIAEPRIVAAMIRGQRRGWLRCLGCGIRRAVDSETKFGFGWDQAVNPYTGGESDE